MFDEFYSKFPKKVARKDAVKAWSRLTAEQQQKALAAIDDHVRMWTAEGRDKQYIPHPASWLNGERFDDEISMPEPKVVNWWTSDQLTMEHGRKIGVPARPGEDMFQYRLRLRAA
jgi:hypothetical protein